MVEYICECCQFSTKLKANYTRHISSIKHKTACNTKTTSINNKIIVPSHCDLDLSVSSDKYKCKYCDKIFEYRQSLSKHIKYHCKKNKDEDLKEFVRLLNKKVELLESNNENLCKQLNYLSKKLQIQNIGNQQNNVLNMNGDITNNVQNINILNHKDTNYDYLTDKDFIECIRSCNYCVKNLIEKVHFDENHPENMNIYISSMKTDYLMLYKDGAWNIVDRNYHIDSLYSRNEIELDNWYDEYKDKYPQIIQKFERYLHNRENNETINMVKKDILRMLYNKRKIVINNHNNNIDGEQLILTEHDN